MIYSKRGPLWADLVWKSALLNKCEILEDLYTKDWCQRKGTVGRPLANICDHMEQCGIPPFPVQSEHGLTPIRELRLFSLPLLPFPQPHWAVFWAWRWKVLTKYPSRMQWMLNVKTSQLNNTRKDKEYQNILPKMPCQRRYQMWCGWEHVAKHRRPGRFYIYIYFIIN